MSGQIDDGGPAFPLPASTQPNGDHQWHEYGMSLRDWFAGQATEADIAEYQTAVYEQSDGTWVDITREQAKYLYADKMIAARKGGAK